MIITAMNVHILEGIWRGILDIKTNGPENRNGGICWNLRTSKACVGLYRGFEQRFIEDAAPSWVKYTGSPSYPIPGINGESPGYTYIRYTTTDRNLWNPEDPYGKLRIEFLDHLLAYATNLMQDYTYIIRQIGKLK